jgi:hypothetical protein
MVVSQAFKASSVLLFEKSMHNAVTASFLKKNHCLTLDRQFIFEVTLPTSDYAVKLMYSNPPGEHIGKSKIGFIFPANMLIFLHVNLHSCSCKTCTHACLLTCMFLIRADMHGCIDA